MKLVEIYEKASVAEFTNLLEAGLDITFSQIESSSKLAGLRAVAYAGWEMGFEAGTLDPDEHPDAFRNPYRDRL